MNTATIQLERLVRSRDPETSWSAAMITEGKWTQLLADVYDIIRERGPLTHDEIVTEYNARVLCRGLPKVTPQRIRTACRALVLGGARDFGRTRSFPPAVRRSEQVGRTEFGRSSQKWEVIDR